MNGCSSAAETHEFLCAADEAKNEAEICALMDSWLEYSPILHSLGDQEQRQVLRVIFKNDGEVALRRTAISVYLIKRLLVAAVLLVLTATSYLLIKPAYLQKVNTIASSRGIAPGSNKAVLSLADGSEIVLNQTQAGQLATQGSVSVIKTKGDQLVYQTAQAAPGGEGLTNMISVPAGGHYQLVMADGTRVWLNSSSSLEYPPVFDATRPRHVILKGEAYFEVAKTKSTHQQRFVVAVNDQEIEVLGTHFNINGYPEELFTATTLLEGSVKVRRPGSFEHIIKPGQQAQVNERFVLKSVDTSVAVAWKNGLFKFEDADIRTVMKQLSRWYDVDVAYEGTLPDTRFNGEVYRNMNAEQTLKILGFAKIRYRIAYPAAGTGRKKIILY